MTPPDVGPPVRTLVVIPTFQEADNIEECLRRLRAAAPDVDALVVDDASTDGTADIVRRVASELGRIDLSERPGKAGLGSAYRHGIGLGLRRGYDRIGQMDADLSHDPGAFPSMESALTDGVGLVIGSRYVPGGSIPNWTRARRWLSRAANAYTRTALGLAVEDCTAGYRLWRASTVRRIGLLETHSQGYLFQIDNTYRAEGLGERIVEVPIVFSDRTLGRSKMSRAVVWEGLTRVAWWAVRDRILRRRPPITPAEVQ